MRTAVAKQAEAGDPDFHQLEPDVELAKPAPGGFSIIKVGEQKALIEQEVHPSATSLTLFGVMDFDASSLGPGAYTITATVLQAGVEKGAVSTLVRKK